MSTPRIAPVAAPRPTVRRTVRAMLADTRSRERLAAGPGPSGDTGDAAPRSAKLMELLRILEALRQVPVEMDPQKVQ